MLQRRPNDARTALLVGVLLATGALATGCSTVLTRSQVDAVQAFATTSQAYPKVPPKVIDAYADARAHRALLGDAVQRLTPPAVAKIIFHKLEDDVKLHAALHQKATQLGDALSILATYGKLLETLSASTPVDDLGKQAEALGDSLDQAIGVYDKHYSQRLPKIGSIFGAAIRGLGGITLQALQARLLRADVTAADPMVQRLTGDVVKLLTPYGSKAEPDASNIEAERQALESTYVAAAKAQGPVLPLFEVKAFAAVLTELAEVQALADHARAASLAYARAHTALKRSLATKVALKRGLAEVTVLGQDLKAAAAVKAAIDKANP